MPIIGVELSVQSEHDSDSVECATAVLQQVVILLVDVISHDSNCHGKATSMNCSFIIASYTLLCFVDIVKVQWKHTQVHKKQCMLARMIVLAPPHLVLCVLETLNLF